VRRSLDTAGATTRVQRFAHPVSQGTVSNCALRDGSDVVAQNANANKIRLSPFLRKGPTRMCSTITPTLFVVEAGDARGASKRETNVKCRRSPARRGTIAHSPGSAATTAVFPSLSDPKAEKFFLVKISLFGTS